MSIDFSITNEKQIAVIYAPLFRDLGEDIIHLCLDMTLNTGINLTDACTLPSGAVLSQDQSPTCGLKPLILHTLSTRPRMGTKQLQDLFVAQVVPGPVRVSHGKREATPHVKTDELIHFRQNPMNGPF